MEILITVFTIIIVFVFIIICVACSKHAESNGNLIYTKIDDVKINDSQIKKVFDYYKTMLIDKKLDMEDVLKDVELRREHNLIRRLEEQIEEDMESNKDAKYTLALSLEFGNYGRSTDGIIFNPEEEVFFKSDIVSVDTIKTIGKNFMYGGIKVSNNGLRIGGGQFYSDNIEELKRFDAGELILTNQRIIFMGSKKSKTIPIGNILSVDNYENNGVIITLSNRENPIIIRFLSDKMFVYNKLYDMMFFSNDLNWFYKALEKVFYKRLVPKDVQELRKEMDEVNFLIARKTMLAEGLEQESITN